MTYCLGILVRDGLVMLADTRTSAGYDDIAIFRKLHTFELPGERILAVAAAGSLATAQCVVSVIDQGLEDRESGMVETIRGAPTMFKAARLVGRAVRDVRRQNQAQDGSADVSMLLGGQIHGGPMRLFMIYSDGGFIEATADTPYLQIGEHKYGKPVLDRLARASTSLDDALKLGLLSMDSTMRSNIGVGLPIDILVMRHDTLRADVCARIEASDPYFNELRERWSTGIRQAADAIPPPPYRKKAPGTPRAA